MAGVQDLVETLISRFPEDAEDLREALTVMQQQRLTSVERLQKLNDSQWQRLGLTIGIESIIRDELAAPAEAAAATIVEAQFEPPARPQTAAPSRPSAEWSYSQSSIASRGYSQACDDDDSLPLEAYEPTEGLHRRSAGGRRQEVKKQPDRQSPASGQQKGLLGPMDFTPPPDLELLWQQLLEDTLPPDKRASLQDSWDATPDDSDRYMMFLEYSSYLRKPEVTEEEKEERRKQLEPLMREFGLKPDDDEHGDSGWQSFVVWSLLIGFVLFFAGVIYFVYARPDPAYELGAL